MALCWSRRYGALGLSVAIDSHRKDEDLNGTIDSLRMLKDDTTDRLILSHHDIFLLIPQHPPHAQHPEHPQHHHPHPASNKHINRHSTRRETPNPLRIHHININFPRLLWIPPARHTRKPCASRARAESCATVCGEVSIAT